MTVSRPCYFGNLLLGVVGVDVNLAYILEDVTYYQDSLASYTFLIDNKGQWPLPQNHPTRRHSVLPVTLFFCTHWLKQQTGQNKLATHWTHLPVSRHTTVTDTFLSVLALQVATLRRWGKPAPPGVSCRIALCFSDPSEGFLRFPPLGSIDISPLALGSAALRSPRRPVALASGLGSLLWPRLRRLPDCCCCGVVRLSAARTASRSGLMGCRS